MYLNARIGADWLQYSLHNYYKLNQITPRINLRIQHRIENGNILFSGNYVNSNYGTDIINNAEIEIDRFMAVKGNPQLNKSYDIVSYIYYMQQFNKKWNISAVSQYNFSHNYVTTDYINNKERIIRTFRNDGDTHLFSEILGLSYQLSTNTTIGGDIRYSHSLLNGQTKIHTNNLTANINAAFYIGDFSIQPTINLAQRSLNFDKLAIYKIPINYSMRCSYSYKNLFLSIIMSSPFTKRKIKTEIQTMPYSQFCEIYNQGQSKYCNISLTYTIDFGKKTKKIENDTDTEINSSLLKINTI